MTDSAGKGKPERLHPPFAQPNQRRRATPAHAVAATESSVDELPSIQEFVDDLPSIDEFLVAAEAEQRSTPVSGLEIDEEGWAAADWQSYDWSGIASLGAPAPESVEAQAAWTSTDWEGGLPANDVAAALEEIASRIRSGDLSLERFAGTPPEAAIAAVFAALLRTKG